MQSRAASLKWKGARMPKVAILDDYAGIALELADWSPVLRQAEVTVFNHHLSENEAVEALQPFDVVCTLRERTAFPRTLIERLPDLKLMTIVGMSLRTWTWLAQPNRASSWPIPTSPIPHSPQPA
jgi:hypothetical protein